MNAEDLKKADQLVAEIRHYSNLLRDGFCIQPTKLVHETATDVWEEQNIKYAARVEITHKWHGKRKALVDLVYPKLMPVSKYPLRPLDIYEVLIYPRPFHDAHGKIRGDKYLVMLLDSCPYTFADGKKTRELTQLEADTYKETGFLPVLS